MEPSPLEEITLAFAQNRVALVAGMTLTALMSGTSMAQAGRDYVYIVGSSTVYPFSTVVAERFGRNSEFKTPKVESTGSGGGLKPLSCQVNVPVAASPVCSLLRLRLVWTQSRSIS